VLNGTSEDIERSLSKMEKRSKKRGLEVGARE
jgi:hypothetical protein